jgi:hypothetical protein
MVRKIHAKLRPRHAECRASRITHPPVLLRCIKPILNQRRRRTELNQSITAPSMRRFAQGFQGEMVVVKGMAKLGRGSTHFQSVGKPPDMPSSLSQSAICCIAATAVPSGPARGFGPQQPGVYTDLCAIARALIAISALLAGGPFDHLVRAGQGTGMARRSPAPSLS